MSNCSINTKKFKQFSLYNLSNGTLTASNAPEYNHILQDSDKVFLVGYKFINATQCPEVKLRLEDVLAASNISLGFNLTDNNELQYTTEYNSQAHINWVNTGIVIPQPSTGCTCDLAMSFDPSTNRLYYTKDGSDALSDVNCDYVTIPTSSESASYFTSAVNYDADNEPYAEFDSDGVFNIHLLSQQSGQDGAPGASAYDIWLDNGHTGTESEFLASLVGPQGETGATGAQGLQGPQGPPGSSVTIQPDAASCTNSGDGYIETTPGSTEGHLMVFNGATFVDAGQIVPTISVDPDPDNNETDIEIVIGSNNYSFSIPWGADGSDGANGSNGTNGTNGVSPSVSIDNTVSGQHTVTITDADGSQSFTVYDGTNGTNGTNGQNGTNGTTIELFRCTVNTTSASSFPSAIAIPEADAVTGLPTGSSNSSMSYYIIPGTQTWEKYDTLTNTYTSMNGGSPNFEKEDVVEICPSDYSPAETALNLIYGTFGEYTFSNGTGSITFYSIKDPSIDKYSFRFVVKVYHNMQ